MKIIKIAIFFGFILILQSCGQYHQLYKINAETSLKVEKKFIVYENDTLSVTYNFWAEKGILSFAIFNKTNKPLYIDWKKSSYILNFQKLNFWEDETSIQLNTFTKTNQKSRYDNYKYQGPATPMMPYQYIGKTSGQANTISTSTSSGMERKPERITFIAPNSFVSNASYILLEERITYFDKKVIKKFSSPKDSMIVYQKKYSETNSPLKFDLFLTFSIKENFESEFYLTNKFYLSEIIELPDKEYFDSDLYEDANYFYFYYPAGQSLFNSDLWNE